MWLKVQWALTILIFNKMDQQHPIPFAVFSFVQFYSGRLNTGATFQLLLNSKEFYLQASYELQFTSFCIRCTIKTFSPTPRIKWCYALRCSFQFWPCILHRNYTLHTVLRQHDELHDQKGLFVNCLDLLWHSLKNFKPMCKCCKSNTLLLRIQSEWSFCFQTCMNYFFTN